MNTRSTPVFTLLTVAALATSAFSFAAEKFTFLTNWYAQAEHGGFYQAQATGLYQHAGLDVEIKMGGPQINVMQLMAAGQARYLATTAGAGDPQAGCSVNPSPPCSSTRRRCLSPITK